MRYKRKYAVICRLVDCEEDWGLFPLTGKSDTDVMVFDRIGDARKAMRKDCEGFEEEYCPDCGASGKNPCRKTFRDEGREIAIDVPIWDGENQRESWIRARWKIVGL